MKTMMIHVCAGLLFATSLQAQQVSTQPASTPATDLDRIVESKRYPELEQLLPAANLDRVSRLYFTGILADRFARFAEAREHLSDALPGLRRSNHPRAALALLALSQDDFMLGHYEAARKDLQEISRSYIAELSPADQRNVRDNLGVFALIRSYPPQTVSGTLSFSITTQWDPIGDLDIPVESNDVQAWWIFDTGANITTLSRSTAARLGLKLSEHRAQTQSGATGFEVPLSTAVIPELKVGTAILHNVVALVLDDRDLAIDLGHGKQFQMQGILGYPALYGLGTFAVSGEQMKIAPSGQSTGPSARLYVEQLTPMVSAGFEGQQILFQFDTGNNGAELTATFKQRFPDFVRDIQEEHGQFAGAGQAVTLPVFSVSKLELTVGDSSALFKHVRLLGRDRGVAPLDLLYGNLGQALLSNFRGYVIDLKDMTFSPRTVTREP